ncbi:g6012 [Coccomyxa viridis]|uniref:G6012 protein n=1 Tax=Coccomyxa viridis TaxID=1274662 RepID=A0ABP1G125_9CHLO
MRTTSRHIKLRKTSPVAKAPRAWTFVGYDFAAPGQPEIWKREASHQIGGVVHAGAFPSAALVRLPGERVDVVPDSEDEEGGRPVAKAPRA